MDEHCGQHCERHNGQEQHQESEGRPLPSMAEPVGGSDQLLLTVPEAAVVLRMSRAKLYELMRRGQVLSVMIGGSRRVPRAAVLTYIGELTEVAEREQAERRQADQRGAVDWRSSWSKFGLDWPA
jgi:excisionase family DNA binding protein